MTIGPNATLHPSTGTGPRTFRRVVQDASRRYQFLAFVIAAGLSVPVNLLTRVAFSRAMPFEFAVALSHVCGMIVAYVLTKLFVFSPSGRSVVSELARFAAVNVLSLAVTWIVAVGLLRLVLPGLAWVPQPEFVAHVTGLAISAVTSFAGHKYFSFARGRSAGASDRTAERT